MSRSNRQRPDPIRDPNWVFRWGKWKGETLSEVLFNDPDYVKWLTENHPEFDVHQDVLDLAEERFQQGMNTLYARDIEKD